MTTFLLKMEVGEKWQLNIKQTSEKRKQKIQAYHKVASISSCYYLQNQVFIQSSQNINIKFPLHKESVNAQARTYLQLPLQQWGVNNVYLLVLSR